LPEHREILIEIFKSNIPLYFAEEELPFFINFIDNLDCPYSVILSNNVIVGCGGIGLNKSRKPATIDTVSMCWGMVDNKYHKHGFGKKLLEFRIQQSKELYPNVKIALGTTQHTFQFFEKYGFKTVEFQKDYWAQGLDLHQMELV
jgi:predicted GNAT family N-acyltransferase